MEMSREAPPRGLVGEPHWLDHRELTTTPPMDHAPQSASREAHEPTSNLDTRDPSSRWKGLEECRPAVIRFLRRRCRDMNEAEDLAQETLLRAVRYRHRQRVRLEPWLIRIAANVFRDHISRLGRGPLVTVEEQVLDGLPGDHEDPGAAVPEELIEIDGEQVREEVLIQDLGAAIAQLKDSDRQVVEGFYGAGFSTARLANCLGISPSLVKVRLFRARKRLGRVLRERLSRRRAEGLAGAS